VLRKHFSPAGKVSVCIFPSASHSLHVTQTKALVCEIGFMRSVCVCVLTVKDVHHLTVANLWLVASHD